MTIDTDRADDAPAAAARHDAAEAVAAELPGAKGGQPAAWAVTIDRPAAELFAFWRDFANLAAFMENVVSVECADARRSHWVVKAPAGKRVEWDAIVTDEQPGRSIAWASTDGDIPNSGRVEFRDAGARGTVVTANLLYDPPGGTLGKLAAKLFQREPSIQVRRDLRRFKQLMETGEIATAANTRKQFEEEAA